MRRAQTVLPVCPVRPAAKVIKVGEVGKVRKVRKVARQQGPQGEQGDSLKRVITDASMDAERNTAYVATNDVAEVVVTLPADPQPRDLIRVNGLGKGGWKIAQNPDQVVKLGVLPGTTWTNRRQMPREGGRPWPLRATGTGCWADSLVAISTPPWMGA